MKPLKHGDPVSGDKFLPYMHYDNGRMREPGTTEDGVERQKLMITAIMENADGVYHAFKNRLKKEREYTEMMDIE